MKHCKLIPALLILVIVTSGCDTVRSWLGKPTSKDIEKARIEKEAAQREAERKAAELAALKLAETQETAKTTICRYNVIVGAFKEGYNADNMEARMTKAGETVTRISFTNGFTAISILNTDDFHAACRKLNAAQSSDILPFDCWIYDSATAKHE